MKMLRQSLLGILCMAAAAGVPLLAAEGAGDPATSANPSLSVIGPAPAFTLHDTSGKVVHLADYQGRVVLLAFIFTSCRGVCPLISRQMAAVQSGLKSANLFGRRANLVSVTVDPATDTADVLARYSRDHGADPAGWRFLTDRPERIKPVLKAYDEWTRLLLKGEIDHPARVYLIDQQSNIREIYSLAFFNEKQALIDMRALLED